jgi:ankyrin repeat/IBR domain-containing protein 1
MGGVESRFNGLLVGGNEKEALELWHSHPDLQARFRPQLPIKSSPHRDTPLHSAARGSMKVVMEELLSNGADPRTKNANGETPLHIVCSSARFSSRTNRLRAELLRLLLDRLEPFEQGREVGNGVLGTGDGEASVAGEADPYRLALTDKSNNTPLHLAATSGLLLCVELLLAHNAPLFVHNIAEQTPCEAAGDAKQLIIAKLLESKMVFMVSQGDPERGKKVIKSRARNRSFHNTKTLTRLRTDIIHQLATDLQVSDYCAQALLMAYSWSDVLVKEAWSEDRRAVCEKAGLDMASVQREERDLHIHTVLASSLSTVECNICFMSYTPDEMVQVPCSHHFCRTCRVR